MSDNPQAITVEGHKTYTIIVEGTPHEWPDEDISYTAVVTLEVPDYAQHPEVNYSVTYREGPRNKPDGILSPGASTKIREGMIFNVTPTGES